MDHLPLPANPTLAPLKIPYLANQVYDGGNLGSYPDRHGWKLSKDGSNNNITYNGKLSTTDSAASFFQTWLYFGLLSVTLGCIWNPQMQLSFLEEGPDGEKWLSTRNLQGIVADWAGYVAEVPDGMSRKAKLRMWWKRYLRIVIVWIKSICGIKVPEYREQILKDYGEFRESMNLAQSVMFFAQRANPQILSNDQTLALTALGMFLNTTWWRIHQTFYGDVPKQLVSLDVGKDLRDTFFQTHMLKMNWCPSDISRIISRSSFAVTWYFANMQPPHANENHGKCSESLCFSCQIDKFESYQLSHRGTNCKCPLIKAELEDLRPILENRGIPIISLSENRSTLKVQDSSEIEFIAISHVWAEGLGNQQDNALQSCKLLHVFDLVEKMSMSKAQSQSLWIDTICVPMQECDSKLNGLAMNKMKDTYKSAAAVLFLDAYVQSFTIRGVSPLEAFSRLDNSSWMQRLWTLQEGRLSKKLYFQFEDGPLELGRIYNAIPLKSFPARAELAISSEITMSYFASRYHTNNEVQKLTDILFDGILATRDAVMFRAVSCKRDEPVCLATLLNLDVTRITSAQEDKRMEALWEMLPRVPLSMVFSKAASKLSTQGFRWAPSSFCGLIPNARPELWGGPDHLWKRLEAVPTQSGLLVHLPGLLLQAVNSPQSGWSNALDLSPNHAFQLSDGRWIGVCLGESWGSLAKDIDPKNCDERLALILDDNSLAEKTRQSFNESSVIGNDIPSRGNSDGIIARVSRLENSCADSNLPVEIHVNGVQHVTILELPPDASTVFGAGVTAARSLWERLPPAQPLTKEVVQVCLAVVKEVMSDGNVVEACRKQRRVAGADDSDDEIMYMLVGMAHAVYLSGFNSAEVVPDGCRWYVD